MGGLFSIRLYILNGLLTMIASQSCLPKECSFDVMNGQSVHCTGGSFSTFPDLSKCSGPIYWITLTRTSITNLTDNSVPHRLLYLSFNDNPLTSVSDGAFDNCGRTLTALTFDGSLNGTIPNALERLTALTILKISNQDINDWNVPVLQKLGTHVQDLTLSSVSLSGWPDWLKHFTELNALEINNITSPTIPDDGLLQVTSKLITLTISQHNFTEIPKAVTDLLAVKFLNLPDGKIKEIKGLPPQVEGLNLENNLIEKVEDGTFKSLGDLETLHLDYNPLVSIAQDAFVNSSVISYLTLQATNLARVPLAFLHMPHMMFLRMEDNAGLVCTCDEAALVPWFENLPYMSFIGDCGVIGIRSFFTTLAKDCPKNGF
ncbi:unnamed protein product [Lymnaea stagnalis]|uniref:Fibromodulin n=1 Tax=Lymnaea stagnalis TaxID=6523 RepID=A0AAV2HYU9_LYMST